MFGHVRREDVYRILPKLERLGLVEKLLGKPTRIRATPVKEALSILIKHEEEASRNKVSALKAKTETFLKHFARTPRLEAEEKGHFALLPHRKSIVAKMLTMMQNAESALNIIFSRSQLMQFVYAFTKQIKKTTEKGVKLRIISELPGYDDALPRLIEERVSPGASVDLRYSDLPSSHYILADFKEALISTTTEGNMAENPCLWTDNDGLVGVFQGDFENLWHNAVSWKMIETEAVSERMMDFMEKLRPTNHLILVYDSPAAKYNVLFNYLKAGLEKGEAGVYVASDEKPSRIREAMKQFGIPAEEYEKTGALHILGHENIYIIDGEFSTTTTMNCWKKLYKDAVEQGFKGLRATGEMACFFKHNLVNELIEYEKALHTVLDMPMIAICAYNANQLNQTKDPVNLYSELAKAHGTVLFTGLDKKLGRMEIRSI